MFSKRDKIPTYDRAKDGNPFDWIVKTADQVRAKREPCPSQTVKHKARK